MKLSHLVEDNERLIAPVFSKRMLRILFNCTFIASVVVLLIWPRQGVHDFIAKESVPLNFSIAFVIVLVVNSYLSLLCGCGEMMRKSFFPKKEQQKIIALEEERPFLSFGLIHFIFHTVYLIVSLIPPLIVSAGLSKMDLFTFIKAMSILFITSLILRLYGFLVYLIFGRWNLKTFFLTRIVFVIFIMFTVVIGSYISPIRLIYSLNINYNSSIISSLNSHTLFTMIGCLIIFFLTMAIHFSIQIKKSGRND